MITKMKLIVAFLIASTLVCGCNYDSSKMSENRIIDSAWVLVSNRLKSPSMAQRISYRTWRLKGFKGATIYTITFDSPNGFGVMMRGYGYVFVYEDKHDGKLKIDEDVVISQDDIDDGARIFRMSVGIKHEDDLIKLDDNGKEVQQQPLPSTESSIPKSNLASESTSQSGNNGNQMRQTLSSEIQQTASPSDIVLKYYELQKAGNYTEIDGLYADHLERFYLSKDISRDSATKASWEYYKVHPNDKFVVDGQVAASPQSYGFDAAVNGEMCKENKGCSKIMVNFKFNRENKITYIRAYNK